MRKVINASVVTNTACTERQQTAFRLVTETLTKFVVARGPTLSIWLHKSTKFQHTVKCINTFVLKY